MVGGDMHGRGHVWWGACMAGGMHDKGSMHGGGAHVMGGMHGRGVCGRGACMAGGMHGGGACMAGDTATAVDGTHPTGMHSCFIFQKKIWNILLRVPTFPD